MAADILVERDARHGQLSRNKEADHRCEGECGCGVDLVRINHIHVRCHEDVDQAEAEERRRQMGDQMDIDG